MFADGTVYGGFLVVLRGVLWAFSALAFLVALDKLVHMCQYVYFKAAAFVLKRNPEDRYTFAVLPNQDLFPYHYPDVAIQLPMFNETWVCQQVIDCCSRMEWPRDRLWIQVLDDSTDTEARERVDERVAYWRLNHGVNITVRRRENRQGYKAGALKEALDELEHCSFVAVFDADFKPDPLFLHKLVPYLMANDELGYVQARWTFTNPTETLLTRTQEISPNYHMKGEQWVHSSCRSFFNFNGTAGIWRRACIYDAGGWSGKTTVEDMDLSLRAFLKGWKMLFLDQVEVLNELPSNLEAYRKQQHRWTCGPVQLTIQSFGQIWASRKIGPLKKLYLCLIYFGLRKFLTHLVSLGFFCVLVPLAMFAPESIAAIPLFVLVQVPITVTVCTSFFTPRPWWQFPLHFVYGALYVLFENAMGVVKIWAVVQGIFDMKRAKEWVVTMKMGAGMTKGGKKPKAMPRRDAIAGPLGAVARNLGITKIHSGELTLACFNICAAVYGVLVAGALLFCVFLSLQGAAFLAFGLGWTDAAGLLGAKASGYASCRCLGRPKGVPESDPESGTPSLEAPTPDTGEIQSIKKSQKVVSEKSIATTTTRLGGLPTPEAPGRVWVSGTAQASSSEGARSDQGTPEVPPAPEDGVSGRAASAVRAAWAQVAGRAAAVGRLLHGARPWGQGGGKAVEPPRREPSTASATSGSAAGSGARSSGTS